MNRRLRFAASLLTLVASLVGAPSSIASRSASTAAIHRVDPSTLRAAVAPSTTRGGSSGVASLAIPNSVESSGSVTLEIVMPADAAMPGDPGCDLSYPQLCVPVGAPDLDCEEMGVAGFVVLAPDVHRLDDDGDGLGCEG